MVPRVAHVAVEVMPWVDLAWTVGLARLVACRVHGKEGELNTELVANPEDGLVVV